MHLFRDCSKREEYSKYLSPGSGPNKIPSRMAEYSELGGPVALGQLAAEPDTSKVIWSERDILGL